MHPGPSTSQIYPQQDSAFNPGLQFAPTFQAAQLAAAHHATPTLGDNLPLPLPSITAPGYPYLAPIGPASAFRTSLEHVATELMPKIDNLTRSALDGINRAYETHTDPAQTAANLQALRTELGTLYTILKETGLGALPLEPDPADANQILQGPDPRVEVLTEQVNAIFREGKNARERATVVVDMLRTFAERNTQKVS
ncbi:hypothetical protein FRB99_005809 [Tulasnella sp. 403]|nr:hypothetical protein FRB99_005809 [Tulasnella sp. 403]